MEDAAEREQDGMVEVDCLVVIRYNSARGIERSMLVQGEGARPSEMTLTKTKNLIR